MSLKFKYHCVALGGSALVVVSTDLLRSRERENDVEVGLIKIRSTCSNYLQPGLQSSGGRSISNVPFIRQYGDATIAIDFQFVPCIKELENSGAGR